MQKKLRELPVAQRAAALNLSESDIAALRTGLTLEQADHMIENVIGTYALPLAVAQNFVVNGRELLVPMVVEESSIVAACSYAAKLAKASGGFTAASDQPIMIGQIQLLDIPDIEKAKIAITQHTDELVQWLNTGNPSTQSKHAHAVGIEIRELCMENEVASFLVLHLLYFCGDAMGANLINTACEAIAPKIEQLTGGRVNLRILSNLSDQRKAWASCTIRAKDLGDDAHTAQRIVETSLFAELDPYRATTHNKGVMNGIDAVVLATGNDWRAVESAAHAYAARNGRYTSLTQWRTNAHGDLVGNIKLPLAVGMVGGATRVHPSAQVALKLIGARSARELAEAMACVGLAQNFAALRALATEGIQAGHMGLHARQMAVAAGATGEQVERIAAQLVHEKNVRLERAKQIIRS